MGEQREAFPVIAVMVPLPAQSHLNQLLHLSHQIASFNIPVHYVGSSIHNLQVKNRSQGWNHSETHKIHFHDFPLPSFTSPLPDPNGDDKFPSHLLPSSHASLKLREPVAKLLLQLSAMAKRVVVVHDFLMASVVQDAAVIHNAETYPFYGVSAFALCSFFQDAVEKPVIIDGVVPEGFPHFEGRAPKEMKDFSTYQKDFLETKSGVLYNTCRAMEAVFLDVLAKFQGNGRQWAIGPLNPISVRHENHFGSSYEKCMKWLDKQEPSSVMYISFGTTTSMVDEQVKELAEGLEQSKIKFIWVLRDADKGDIFNGETRRHELPERFEERIEGQGMVVREWAPQLEILRHESTGGFMSHCGWGSCMESLSMGVPMAAWPMHSDQPCNAVLVTEYLKVGILMRKWEQRNETLSSSAISEVVRKLIVSEEGKEMKERARKLGCALQESVEKDGVSHKELESFISHITR